MDAEGKGKRAQSALELLTTYSWALLIIAIFVAAVAIINSSRPATNYLASSCVIQPLLPCAQALLTYTASGPIKFSMLFTDNLGQTMYLPVNALNITVTNVGVSGTTSYTGNCTPSLALAGSEVLCSAYISGSLKPSIGTQENVQFTLTYTLCNGNTKASCPSGTYKSTGTASQTMSPSSVTFHKLTVQTNPTSGSVNLNGFTYVNGANVILLSGNYPVYGIPPAGYGFTSWTLGGINGGTSSLSSSATQNSVLALGSNATLTASFNTISATTTVALSSTSTSTSTTVPGTSATFTETGLPGGTSWCVTLGIQQCTTSATDTFTGLAPAVYSWSATNPTCGTGCQGLPSPSSGSISTVSGSGQQGISYALQYLLTMGTATGGTATPSSQYYTSGAPVTINAISSSGWSFVSWGCSGSGCYSGTSNPYTFSMPGNPITETPGFGTTVTFTETGLGAGTSWSVTLNGVGTQASTSNTITFSGVSPGSYTWSTASAISCGTGCQYATSQTSGSVSTASGPASQGIAYTTQYYLTMAAGANGAVSPSDGWYNSGTMVTITGTPNSGYIFSSWSGSGTGSYTGTTNPHSVTMNGAVSETASFATSALYPIGNPSFTYYGSWQTSIENTQNYPANTIANDGNYGYMWTNDAWTAQDEGAYWIWDFGSSMTKTFTVKWYQTTSPYSGYCINFATTLYASNDGSSWTQFASFTQTSGSGGSYGSAGSPIVSTTSGTYRYIKVQQYSTVSCMAGTGDTYVDTVYAS